jgi:hypothetical protein
MGLQLNQYMSTLNTNERVFDAYANSESSIHSPAIVLRLNVLSIILIRIMKIQQFVKLHFVSNLIHFFSIDLCEFACE